MHVHARHVPLLAAHWPAASPTRPVHKRSSRMLMCLWLPARGSERGIGMMARHCVCARQLRVSGQCRSPQPLDGFLSSDLALAALGSNSERRACR